MIINALFVSRLKNSGPQKKKMNALFAGVFLHELFQAGISHYLERTQASLLLPINGQGDIEKQINLI